MYSLKIFYQLVKRKFFRTLLGLFLLKLQSRKNHQFTCPICKYKGPFISIEYETGIRKHALCPKCNSCERHRLQYLVVKEIAKKHDLSRMSILHFAPETFLRKFLKDKFSSYTSADFIRKDVDYRVDITNLPFENESFDFVFASHVLEHIKDDNKALSEIARTLKHGGIAVLPVPITGAKTVEYPESNPHEAEHVRAPGSDYYEKYSSYFTKIENFDSQSFSEDYQLFLYEDRSKWPDTMPFRPTVEGEKHVETVPVCYK